MSHGGGTGLMNPAQGLGSRGTGCNSSVERHAAKAQLQRHGRPAMKGSKMDQLSGAWSGMEPLETVTTDLVSSDMLQQFPAPSKDIPNASTQVFQDVPSFLRNTRKLSKPSPPGWI